MQHCSMYALRSLIHAYLMLRKTIAMQISFLFLLFCFTAKTKNNNNWIVCHFEFRISPFFNPFTRSNTRKLFYSFVNAKVSKIVFDSKKSFALCLLIITIADFRSTEEEMCIRSLHSLSIDFDIYLTMFIVYFNEIETLIFNFFDTKMIFSLVNTEHQTNNYYFHAKCLSLYLFIQEECFLLSKLKFSFCAVRSAHFG